MRRLFSSVVFASGMVGVAAVASAQSSLTKDSPFLPVAGSGPAAVANSDTLLFTGVSGSGATAIVCIFDAKLKRSYWIPVGSTSEGIKVLSVDPAREQVTLTAGGEQKQLTLRSPSVAQVAAAPITSVSTTAATAPAPLPAVTQGTPQPPPVPGSVAHQETEARMLVSDLLEIGIQQRKAYEEAQKKAEAERNKKS